jgi:hypothetical protein
MQIEPSDIDVEVYAHDPNKERFFLKVTFNGMGMFINSFSVQPSKFENQEHWVQPPTHRQGQRWTQTVDFDKSYPLWNIIEKKSFQAVKDFLGEEARVAKDKVIEPKDDEPINLDDIPF